MMIFFWLLIGFGVYYIVKAGQKTSQITPKRNSAIEILNERLVNGEIDEITYNRIRKIIEK